MIERIKTLVILLLILSLAALLFISFSLSTASFPLKPSDMFYELFGKINGSDAQTDSSLNPAAIFPCQIAVSSEKGIYMPQTPSLYDEAFSAFNLYIEEALLSAENPLECSSDDYASALLRDGVLFVYDRPLPFDLISEWYGGKGEKERYSVISLFLCGEGEKAYLYLRADDGRFFRFDTKIEPLKLESICRSFDLNGVFASKLPGAVCDPFSPLPTVYSQMPVYTVLPPAYGNGAELPRDLLKDLSINTYLTSVYNDGGSLVYVEGQNTLRLFSDGRMVYSGSLETVNSFQNGDILSELLSGVYPVLFSLWQKASSGGSVLSLSSVYTDKYGKTVFTFGAYVGGCLIERETDACTVTFDGRKIVGLSIYPIRISYFDDANVLPYAQASAAASPNAFLRMQYFPDENGYLIPRIRGFEGGKN